MEKFIPYEKLSKKEKRKMDQARRQTWGELNPVTRKPEHSRAYNRRKSQDLKREVPPTACDYFISQKTGKKFLYCWEPCYFLSLFGHGSKIYILYNKSTEIEQEVYCGQRS